MIITTSKCRWVGVNILIYNEFVVYVPREGARKLEIYQLLGKYAMVIVCIAKEYFSEF